MLCRGIPNPGAPKGLPRRRLRCSFFTEVIMPLFSILSICFVLLAALLSFVIRLSRSDRIVIVGLTLVVLVMNSVPMPQ